MMARLMGLDTITPQELHRLLPEHSTAVIDVNSPQSWMHARVPGAIHLDPTGNDVAALPSNKNALVVFYCSNPWCRKAPNAARRAKSLGYTNVRVMAAGIEGWLRADLPVENS
jgi:rhodanese-related sulfurtransferase